LGFELKERDLGKAPIEVKWQDLLHAFNFVNSAPKDENLARLSLASGRIELHSVWTELWAEEGGEKKTDGETLDIPHKTDLGLGRDLVLWFVEEVIPEQLEDVTEIFQKRGAYAKFRALLEEEGLMQQWYLFEGEAEQQGLRNWCEENGISILEPEQPA
jgi:hypothetical protein